MHRLLLIVAVAGTSLVGPSGLLPDDAPAGFERAPDPAIDLSFDEYAPLAPDAVAHVDPTSPEAAEMSAAVDVWSSADSDILLREVTLWGTEDAAAAFVDQATVVGIEQGLTSVESTVVGGVAFIGQTGGLWTRTRTWRQGPYALNVSHFSTGAGSDAVIDATVATLVDTVEERTGHGAAERTVDATIDESTSGGGISIVTVLILAALLGGAIWFARRQRRRSRGDADRPRRSGARDAGGGRSADESDANDGDGEDLDVDDIIERARARARAEREVEAIPDASADWTPPERD